MKAPHRIGPILVRVVSRGIPSDNVTADSFRIGPEQEVTCEVWPIPAAFYRAASGQHSLDITGIEANGDRRKGASKIAPRHLQHFTDEYVTGRTRTLCLGNIFLIHIFFCPPCEIVKTFELEGAYLASSQIVRPAILGQL